MLILLPPSEGKATRRRGQPMSLQRLSLPALETARADLMAALTDASSRPDALAVLGVGESLAADVEANLRLGTAPALKVSELYTGVLFDALDLASLDVDERRRAVRQVRVFSALHGVLSLTDRVSPYRLAVGVDLPGVGAVSAFWRERLGLLDQEWSQELLVDCRSGSYRAMWRPSERSRWVRVEVPAASHFAKRTRGLVARALVRPPGRLTRPHQLLDVLAAFSPELTGGASGWTLTVSAPD